MKDIKRNISIAITSASLLCCSGLCASQQQVTLKNDKNITMYLLATESASKPGDPYANPKISPFIGYAFAGSGDASYDNHTNIVTMPAGSSFTFLLDSDAKTGSILGNGVTGGRIYASDSVSALPSAPDYTPTIKGNPNMLGFIELSYNATMGGKCIDLSNVDSFDPVRFEANIVKSDGKQVDISYYDTYSNIYDALLSACKEGDAAKDNPYAARILSPITSDAWDNNLTQNFINSYFKSAYNNTIGVNMIYSCEKGSYTLKYACVWDDSGKIICTDNGSAPESAWNGSGTAPQMMILYVNEKAPGGGNLTPALAMKNSAPEGEWFYTYNGTLGNIGADIDKPGTDADMACNFISQQLLAGLSNEIISKLVGYSSVIDKNSAAYSAPNSDAQKARKDIVLQKLDDCKTLTIKILSEVYKYIGSNRPVPPSGGGLPVGTMDPQIASPDVYNNGSTNVSVLFYSVSTGITMPKYPSVPVSGAAQPPLIMDSGYVYTLPTYPYGINGSKTTGNTGNISVALLPLQKAGNSTYTIQYDNSTILLTVDPVNTKVSADNPKVTGLNITKNGSSYTVSMSLQNL